MSNIIEIAINLGNSVEEIIAECDNQLNAKNRFDIEAAIEASRTSKAPKASKSNTLDESKKRAMQAVLDNLLKYQDADYILLEDMMAPAAPMFTASSSAITQFKKFLRENYLDHYALDHAKRGKKTVYKIRSLSK